MGKPYKNNRRAGGDGLCNESHWRSVAETCKKPRGSIAHSLKGYGIHFVNLVKDVKGVYHSSRNCNA